jgi:hypothetical protein
MTEILKVTAIGPYGINCGGTWYKLGKGITTNLFQRGTAYTVEVATSAKGAKFINKIIGTVAIPTPSVPLLDPTLNTSSNALTTQDVRPLNEYGKPVSDYAIAKDKRIARSGVIQAAVQAMSPHVSNREQLEKESILLAEAMLTWVQQ